MEKKYKILSINPGSTSTKVALYENEVLLAKKSIEHSIKDLENYEKIIDQKDMRYKEIVVFLKEVGYNVEALDGVVGRGGMLPPVESGAYRVNEKMVDYLTNDAKHEHASNLGALLAYEIANNIGINAYIYDPVSVDQFEDISRISGLDLIERESFSHALNMRASGIKVAKSMNKNYNDMNFVIAHLGGGISVGLHYKGRIIDTIPDDEGAFSPERSGGIPCKKLVEICFSGKYDKKDVLKLLRGKGGITSYLGSNNALEVEKKINSGDKKAKLIYEAMAYQISKCIGQMATVAKGNVDNIIITGGIAYSDMIIGWIKDRVEFIAPVIVVPGENELESLTMGLLRIIRGEEIAKEYI
jgi:butyrate kinase